jgi:hypothetical protein
MFSRSHKKLNGLANEEKKRSDAARVAALREFGLISKSSRSGVGGRRKDHTERTSRSSGPVRSFAGAILGERSSKWAPVLKLRMGTLLFAQVIPAHPHIDHLHLSAPSVRK